MCQGQDLAIPCQLHWHNVIAYEMFGALLISALLMASVLNRVARSKWKQACHFILLLD